MSSASDRRKSGGGDSEGGGANWMDTYGDLVTLLLTFFVLLFSFSSVDADKWKALVGAFSGSNVTIVDPFTPELVNAEPIPLFNTLPPDEYDAQENPTESNTTEVIDPATADELLIQLYEGMLNYAQENEINADIRLIADEYMIIMRFEDRVFFNSGEAVLLPESYPILDHVIEMFSRLESKYARISIEGHTDNVPIDTVRYPSNWELSIDRALNVQRYIMSTERLDPMRLKIGGYGEYDPIDTNETPEGRAKNRRVDFTVEGIRPKMRNTGG